MKFELLCSGTAPLLMHNARLANPWRMWSS